jgi:osmotically inducible protein OsmC
MATERTAEVTWRGSLLEGEGTIESVASGAFGPLAVTWAARSEDVTHGRTSPEELIAAAHASCFSMALSHALAQAGTPPDELKTSVTVTFVPGEGITKIVIRTHGEVPGLDDAGFRAAAETAKESCPVSKALAGVPEILLDTRRSIRLEGPQ